MSTGGLDQGAGSPYIFPKYTVIVSKATFQTGRNIKESVKELHTLDTLKQTSTECEKYKASWSSQFLALLKRSWLCVVREPGVFYVRVLKNLVSHLDDVATCTALYRVSQLLVDVGLYSILVDPTSHLPTSANFTSAHAELGKQWKPNLPNQGA